MKRKTFTLNLNLLSRLLLTFALITGGSNAWADTTIFGGTVASGWNYKNGAGTTMSVTSSVLSNYNSAETPASNIRYYSSNSTITISSGQTIAITAKKYGSTSAGYIKVKYSSDNGETWTTAKEYTYTSDLTASYQNLTEVDNIVGTYMIQFEFLYATISAIILKEAPTSPILSITHPVSGDDFGYVTVNSTKTYTVENKGAGSMDVNITSSNAAFTLSTSSLTGITNNDEGQTFDVTFNYDADAPEPHYATITITPTFEGALAQTINVSAGPEVYINENEATTWTSGNGKNVYVKYTAVDGWNTICLPISPTSYKTQLFGSGATVKFYALNAYNSETGTLTFGKASYPASAIPYLVYVENAASAAFVLNNVLVGNMTAGNNTKSPAKFQGTYAPITKTNFTSSMYGVTSAGQIRPGDGVNAWMKGYRAYFTGVSAPSGGSLVKMLIIEDEGTTDLGIVKMVDAEAKDVYTLTGQKVQKGRKGIYIVNGKKVVIK